MNPNFLKKVKIQHVIVLGILAIFVLSSSLHLALWFYGKKLEQSTLELVQKQNLSLAKSGSHTLESFLNQTQVELMLLSQIKAIQEMQKTEAEQLFLSFSNKLNSKKELYGAIGLANKEGLVIAGINIPNQTVCQACSGKLISDQEYFTWAKNQTKPDVVYITDPMLVNGSITKNDYIIIIATPVFNNRQFNGLLFLSFPIEKIKDNFLTPLSDNNPAIKPVLLSDNDYIICSYNPSSMGLTMDQRFAKLDDATKTEFLKQVQDTQELDPSAIIMDILDYETGEMITTVVGLSKVQINHRYWNLYILTFYKDLENFNLELKNFRDIMVYLASIIPLALALIFIVGLRIAQTHGYVNGLIHRKKIRSKLKKKN